MQQVEQKRGAKLPGRRGKAESLTDWARARGEIVLKPLICALAAWGVHPNTVTILGFVLQTGVGVVFGLGRIQLGGLLLLLVAPMDALDGALARAVGRKSRFGAFLDSTLDRLSDAALLLGLLVHYLGQQATIPVVLLLIALVAAMMVSYVRARAESLGFSCRVGLLTRMERIALLGALTALGLPIVMAWALAVLSVLTAVQRIIYVYLSSRDDD